MPTYAARRGLCHAARPEEPPMTEPHDIEAGRDRWQQRYDASVVRDADFTTLSGVEVEPVYGPSPEQG